RMMTLLLKCLVIICLFGNSLTVYADEPAHCTTLFNQANDLYESGHFTEAQPLYQQVLNYSRRENACVDEITDNALGFLFNILFGDYIFTAEPDEQSYCTTLLNQANEQRKQGHFTKTLQLYQQVLDLSLETGCPAEMAAAAWASLLQMGSFSESQQRFAKATEIYQTTLLSMERLYGAKHEALNLFLPRLASIYFIQANYAEAKQLWQRSLTLYKNAYGTEFHIDIAKTRENLASIEVELANYASAKTQYQHALAIYGELGTIEPDNVASLLHNLGVVEEELGDYRSALSLYQQALTIFETAYPLNHREAIATLKNLAGLHHRLGQYSKAKSLYLKALAIGEQHYGTTEHTEVAATLSNLAGLYYTLEDYSQAESLYRKALAIDENIYGTKHPNVASTLADLAELYRTLEDYSHAESLYRKALAIYENLYGTKHPHVASTLISLARLYLIVNDYARAEQLSQRALAIYEGVYGSQQHPNVASTLINLAILYYYLNDCVRAKPLYQSALDIFEQTYGSEHPVIAETLHNLALCDVFDEDYEKANKHFQRTLSIYKKVYGTEHSHIAKTLSAFGSVNEQQGHYEEAMRLYREALTLFEKTDWVEHSHVVGPLLHLTVLELLSDKIEIANAELRLQRALFIAIQSEQPLLIGKALLSWGVLLFNQKNSAAILFIKQSLNILQSIRGRIRPLDRTFQHAFIQNKAISYEYAAVFLIEQGRLPEALQILEMYKEEEYFDFVQRDPASDQRTTQASYTDLENDWATRYTRLSQQLATLGQKKRELKRQAKRGDLTEAENGHLVAQIEKDISETKQTFSAFLEDLKTAFKQAEPEQITKTPTKAQNHLDRLQGTLRDLGHGAVLVHYLITEKLYILLTTPHKQIVSEVAISKKELNKKIDDFREILEDEEEEQEQAQALYNLLIKPIAADLAKAQAKTLMVSLDGTLRYLPMAALYDGKQYLVERYAIVRYSQAAKNTLRHPPKPISQWTIAGLGVSEKVREDFEALTKAEEELKRIVCQNENDSDCVLPGIIYLNDQFTAETMQQVLTENYSLLHIASHFEFERPATDLSSYLLLGDGTELSLAEIRKNYHFDGIDLLTLSACETAVGAQTGNGREIDGFGILAQNKGARGILATLWAVDSESTSQFMPKFYRVLTENPELTKAEALQQTQKDFISSKEYAHPFYWAPFILMGNWLGTTKYQYFYYDGALAFERNPIF
ncbi:MAG TPA: tetratricopeptide repeat protein, partial [Thioploca sp.]|nr:tetratricopeptide repeat protein [Thioploca sp.]